MSRKCRKAISTSPLNVSGLKILGELSEFVLMAVATGISAILVMGVMVVSFRIFRGGNVILDEAEGFCEILSLV